MKLSTILLTIIAMLVANLPLSVWLTRIFSHKNLLEEGSKHASIANQYRVNGIGIGTLILAFEIAKVYWPLLFGIDKEAYTIVLLGIIIGSSLPILYPGGKARTVGLYGLLVINPAILVCVILAWGLVYLISRNSYVASIAGCCGIFIGSVIFQYEFITLFVALLATMIYIYTTIRDVDDFDYYFHQKGVDQ
ncbi:MAG: glycerol-3-phosphate acyltransferase [Erysipelotrichaceae bacterium]